MSDNSDEIRSKLRPTSEMRGEDHDETHELHAILQAARDYLAGFTWCSGIEEEFFGLGIGGVVGVFLFRIRPIGEADEWLWVIAGDLPSSYVVTDQASSPVQALEIYCDLMEAWVRVVRHGGDLRDVFPVVVEPTLENAELLEKRVFFLRKKVIPAFASTDSDGAG